MKLPGNVKPEDVMHPTGVFFRNPTHVDEANDAADQSQIVKAIKGAKRERATQVLKYDEESKPWVLPGFSKVKDLNEVEMAGLLKSLMRYRPNIFKVHIKLGEYPSARQIINHKTKKIDSYEPRFYTEVGERIADVLADKTLNVTEIIYTVHNSDIGAFSASAEVFGFAEDSEYEDEDLFTPAVLVEYFSNQ